MTKTGLLLLISMFLFAPLVSAQENTVQTPAPSAAGRHLQELSFLVRALAKISANMATLPILIFKSSIISLSATKSLMMKSAQMAKA